MIYRHRSPGPPPAGASSRCDGSRQLGFAGEEMGGGMNDDALLEQMRANPRADWAIADVERLCRRFGIKITAPRRGSHYKVRDGTTGTTLTIPARRPIRAVYIRALVALVDRRRMSGERT